MNSLFVRLVETLRRGSWRIRFQFVNATCKEATLAVVHLFSVAEKDLIYFLGGSYVAWTLTSCSHYWTLTFLLGHC